MKSAIFASAVAAGLAVTSPASAATVVLTTTADAQVQNGGGPVLVTDVIPTMTLQAGPANTASKGVFEFDLSSIADTSTVTSALFGFTLATFVTAANPVVEFTVDAYLGDGVVTTADFSAVGTTVIDDGLAARIAGGPLVPATDTGTVHSFAFSTLVPVQDALAGNLLTLRLQITNFPEQLRIATLESTVFAAATLTVDATLAPPPPPPPSPIPLPAGLPLLLAGLGALGLLRRERR